ncbi:serine/threonine-protein kinase [Umezawaea beigongshangensis]|uniref:serine/threonine-protein kinase n=1 Tax=Umezawaea beigongshangensis TaxID=2780383 RepID=UPI0018F2277D|nr:serine/threonine-protein kinase [Umezawaea beigongshangensis]
MQPLTTADPRSVDRYRVLGRLGAGGMGRVLLALAPDGGLVAVKLVHQQFADDDRFRRRFRTEVAAACSVDGAWTAAVVDAGPAAPVPWLATAYVPGPTLDSAVRRFGPLGEDVVLGLAAGLTAALREIHRAGLIHRDLKPGNVLLAADGPRVIDFGITRAVEESRGVTATGFVIGSPGFAAPEHVQGRELTIAADVFSLGATLFFAATGREPFREASTAATLFRLVHGEADLQLLPSRLRAVIGACLAKEPEQRPTTERLLGLIGVQPARGAWLPQPLRDLIRRQGADAAALRAAAHPPRPTLIAPVPSPRRRSPRRGLWTGAAVALALVTGTAGVALTGVPGGLGRTTAEATTGTTTPGATTTPPVADERPVTRPSLEQMTVPMGLIGTWSGTVVPDGSGGTPQAIRITLVDGAHGERVGRLTTTRTGCTVDLVLRSVRVGRITVEPDGDDCGTGTSTVLELRDGQVRHRSSDPLWEGTLRRVPG